MSDPFIRVLKNLEDLHKQARKIHTDFSQLSIDALKEERGEIDTVAYDATTIYLTKEAMIDHLVKHHGYEYWHLNGKTFDSLEYLHNLKHHLIGGAYEFTGSPKHNHEGRQLTICGNKLNLGIDPFGKQKEE
jgi:hypothetical protein